MESNPKSEKKEKLNICIFPMELVWGNVNSNMVNLENAMKLIKTDTDLLVLPETFSTGFPSDTETEDFFKNNSNDITQTIDIVERLSAAHGIAVAGSLIVEEDGKRFNRAFFVTPDGRKTFADKKHLFTMAGEHRFFTPGTRRMVVDYKGWNIAMVICYDIRFPVWCRNVENEYDLMLAVANWPVARIKAWEKLLMARAIENEAYVVGVNCKGIDNNGFEYNGSSMLIDFKGESIGEVEAPFIYGEMVYEKLKRFRTKFPAWQDADRFELI